MNIKVEYYSSAKLMNYADDFDNAIKLINNEKININVCKSDDKKLGVIIKNNIFVGLFQGGLNGRGNWKDYFYYLSKLVETLNDKFNIYAWLIELKIDCLDDVFLGKFGLIYNNDIGVEE